jgi:hypothetical protein
MLEFFRKIVSIAMAFIVLFSTMSFSVDMHYCGDHLVDFNFYEKVDACLMKADNLNSGSECSITTMDMDCCTDVQFSQDGQDDLKITFDHISFDQQLFLASFVYSYVNLFEGFDKNIVPFGDYSPPPLIRDIQILDQTFLI